MIFAEKTGIPIIGFPPVCYSRGKPAPGPRMKLGVHLFSRFDRRTPIQPVIWPHHDLFWVHDGTVDLTFVDTGHRVRLVGPDGVLILPRTRFRGSARGGFAFGSVFHFSLDPAETTADLAGPGVLVPRPEERSHLHSMVRLALHLYRQRPSETARRARLLLALLDGFATPDSVERVATAQDRLETAWAYAARTLHSIRGLADVAAQIGLTESRFRALHRAARGGSAGAWLRELRLVRAEELLAASTANLDEIAAAVGYGHAETLGAAFRKSRGLSPGAFRRKANPFL